MSDDKMKNPILKVKNFGPIGENKNKKGNLIDDGFFTVEFAPVTVFIGSQASGKSTIAKLAAGFLWLEKYFFKTKVLNDNVNIDESTATSFIFENAGLEEYFTSKTEIEYHGHTCIFKTNKSKKIRLDSSKEFVKQYFRPKILYIPADRNLISSVKSPKRIKGLSKLTQIFIDKYYDEVLPDNDGKEVILPVKGFTLKFDIKQQKILVFYEHKSQVCIENTSSGIQSVTPMFLASEYYSRSGDIDFLENLRNADSEIFLNIKSDLKEKELEQKLQDIRYGKKVDDDYKSKLQSKYGNYFNRCFINIVEEPEQNLFPETQAEVLYELLKCKNANEHNKLIFSTHSPYLLTSLNNAIYAEEVFEKTKKEIPEFPKEKRIAYKNVSAYKCENGGIFSIKDDETHLIDADAIDDCSDKINSNFDKLLEMLPND